MEQNLLEMLVVTGLVTFLAVDFTVRFMTLRAYHGIVRKLNLVCS